MYQRVHGVQSPRLWLSREGRNPDIVLQFPVQHEHLVLVSGWLCIAPDTVLFPAVACLDTFMSLRLAGTGTRDVAGVEITMRPYLQVNLSNFPHLLQSTDPMSSSQRC